MRLVLSALLVFLGCTSQSIAQNIKSSRELLNSRMSRWIEVLNRDLKDCPQCFDWYMMRMSLNQLGAEGYLNPEAKAALLKADWKEHFLIKRKTYFGLADKPLRLTAQSHLIASLQRIDQSIAAADREILPPLRWMFLWDAAVEGNRLEDSIQIKAVSPWKRILKEANEKLKSGAFALDESLINDDARGELKAWVLEAQALKEENRLHSYGPVFSIMLLLLAREGIESMIVIFCLIAGLSLAGRREVFKGAVMALLVSLVGFFLLQLLISRDPNALWIRYFVLFNVIFSMGVLLIANNFNFHKFYWSGWISKLREGMGEGQAAGALLGAGFFAVFREGIELSLALNLLQMESGPSTLVKAFLFVLPLWILFALALFVAHKKLSLRTILLASGALMLLVTIVFASFATRLLQAFEWLPVTPFIRDAPIPSFVEGFSAYNGSLEATLAMLFTALIVLVPAIKSLMKRAKDS